MSEQPVYVPRCYCGEKCSLYKWWPDGGRRYWACMNKEDEQPDKPTCEFEVWMDEPCNQEYYKERIYDLHITCTRQAIRERRTNQEIDELKAKLNEVEEEKKKSWKTNSSGWSK